MAISNIKNKNKKIIFKNNPLKELSEISAKFRKSLDANNITITGSSGKTSVKELTGFCLNQLTKSYSSKNSFNNKFGVPLSLFNAPQESKYIVLEAGMDKKGEIDYLTKLIKPNLGLITNISYAHIENFKTMDNIAEAKGEIINNIVPGGTMVLNLDDKYFKYYLGGETPFFKLENLTKYLGGAEIWCKDVSAINGDAHKAYHATVNALICKESGKKFLAGDTGA